MKGAASVPKCNEIVSCQMKECNWLAMSATDNDDGDDH